MPKIKKPPPSNFTTEERNNVSLPCYPTGFPTPVVTWYKNGEALDGDQYNAATGLLTFSSILFADRGLYKCEARNFLGFDYATVEITVEGKVEDQSTLENYFHNLNLGIIACFCCLFCVLDCWLVFDRALFLFICLFIYLFGDCFFFSFCFFFFLVPWCPNLISCYYF